MSFYKYSKLFLFVFLLLLFSVNIIIGQGIISDHNSCDLTQIPQRWIDSAKTKLHIAYGHTSHGSQITTGMTGLVTFINNGGLGLSYPENLFAWNNGGADGALDLHDYAMAGDVGYYPAWYNNTISYLDNPSNSDVNVIIWSWCGQVSGNSEQEMIDEYLNPMTALETTHPGVTFVYMTGHLDGSGEEGNLHQRNEQIRTYCLTNGKVLYDFADIESYDPEGNYYLPLLANDNCDYDSDGNGSVDANWAIDWQNSHTEGVDWYTCYAAHSQSLNANLKAYAAWWLWARLAGWDPAVGINDLESRTQSQFILQQNYPNPFNPGTTIIYDLYVNSQVELTIFNSLGQKLETLVNTYQTVDHYEATWNASNYPSGIYFYRLWVSTPSGNAGTNFSETKKMVIMK